MSDVIYIFKVSQVESGTNLDNLTLYKANERSTMKLRNMQLSFDVEKKKEMIIQYIGVEQLLKELEIYFGLHEVLRAYESVAKKYDIHGGCAQ